MSHKKTELRVGKFVWVSGRYTIPLRGSIDIYGPQNREVKKIDEKRKVVILDCGGEAPIDQIYFDPDQCAQSYSQTQNK